MTKTWTNGGTWGITIHIGSSYPPVYQQVIDQVRIHIASGHLKPGEKLPTVRELADALGINFNTVAKAYHELAGQGLVLGRQGGGSSVLELPPVMEGEKTKIAGELYHRMVAEAAAYGMNSTELKELVLKEGKI